MHSIKTYIYNNPPQPLILDKIRRLRKILTDCEPNLITEAVTEYIKVLERKINRKRIGYLSATADESTIVIEWSLCHRKDNFKKSFITLHNNCDIPHIINKFLPKFIERSKKYFKLENVCVNSL